MTTEMECVDGARLANANAAAWWTELAAARGHALIRQRGYLWVPGSLRSGLRIMVLRPDLDPTEVAEIVGLASSWPSGSRITVEDPFSVLDLTSTGLKPMRLPVMLREPGPVTGTPRVAASRVTGAAEVALAEKAVVDGFPLRQFLPYRESEATPFGLAQRPGIAFHLARRDGEPAGACLTIDDGVAGGIYWVATLPEHRSRGVGRAVMTAALNHLGDRPATLTATAAGRPLYESMGFRTVAEATWWWPPIA
ncbi:MAG TPA: GNAT family N-acetyltransferase [Pseudonocardiaceae bacterium]|nr:GNAT family N-acetyltransferase [Pseudonocardiaceae bacterium]